MAESLMDDKTAVDPNAVKDDKTAVDPNAEKDDKTAVDPNAEKIVPGASIPVVSPFFAPDGFKVDTVPEKFRTKDGKVDVSKVLGSYGELEKLVPEIDKDGPPEGDYVFNPPEVDGFTKEKWAESVPVDDPLLLAMGAHAKEHKWSQKRFDGVVSQFLKTQIEAGKRYRTAQIEELGGEGPAKELLARNQTFWSAKLPADQFKVLHGLTESAAAARLFDHIRTTLLKEPGQGGGPDPVSKTLTEEELRGKMREPAYTDRNHPDHKRLRKEVDDGYKALYPGKKG